MMINPLTISNVYNNWSYTPIVWRHISIPNKKEITTKWKKSITNNIQNSVRNNFYCSFNSKWPKLNGDQFIELGLTELYSTIIQMLIISY